MTVERLAHAQYRHTAEKRPVYNAVHLVYVTVQECVLRMSL